MLSLEENLESIEDPFMKKALQLVVDGTDPDLLRNMMETEMELFEEELDGERAVLESAGAYAPAFGMIGTLIGLIQMLKSLNNPETLGPSMAVALITTLYGAVLANGVFLPMAEKIKREEIFWFWKKNDTGGCSFYPGRREPEDPRGKTQIVPP